MALTLGAILPAAAAAAPPLAPPPPPAVPAPAAARQAPQHPERDGGQDVLRGETLVVNGRRQQAQWRWHGRAGAPPRQLWLPLEVLQNQLGVSSRSLSDGSLDLEWFGQGLKVPPAEQQPLADEVAVDAMPLLGPLGVRLSTEAGVLHLRLPPASVRQVRSANQGNSRRVVLDLSAPALVRQEGSELVVDISADAAQRAELQRLGLPARIAGLGLGLRSPGGAPERVFTLGEPNRLVIDLPAADSAAAAGAPAPIDPRLLALVGRGLRWDRLNRSGMRINAVRMAPGNGPLRLAPLPPNGGMQGLLTLPQLAAQNQALVAINAGYFNRVRQLPLGALKRDGQWLSGPILNRGVAAWTGRELPRFGRLSLQEWVSGPDGDRHPITVVNSGYVQRGLSRYDANWGAAYQALSGAESGLLLRNGSVHERFDSLQLEQGVPLRAGDTLLVARGGAALPWREGTRLSLHSRPSSTLGEAEQVVGGGPLLLENGQVVLNGAAETFSAAFLRQRAPRTVLASDGQEVWLITLEGESGPGPTLEESARVLQQLGLRDALNLDGGSSTGLVMGGSLQVKGRGVAGRVHNGVGLVAP